MARKVQVLLEDDLDGSEADETVSFGLDGVAYEIDLTEEHASALRRALEPWIAGARKVAHRGVVDLRSRGSERAAGAADIRRWAAENGIPVSPRGRISLELRTRYEAEHPLPPR